MRSIAVRGVGARVERETAASARARENEERAVDDGWLVGFLVDCSPLSFSALLSLSFACFSLPTPGVRFFALILIESRSNRDETCIELFAIGR